MAATVDHNYIQYSFNFHRLLTQNFLKLDLEVLLSGRRTARILLWSNGLIRFLVAAFNQTLLNS